MILFGALVLILIFVTKDYENIFDKKNYENTYNFI